MTGLGSSGATALDPIGQEIGGLVATLAQIVIDSQNGVAPSFSIQGVQGTNPAQFVTPENAILGNGTVKGFIDKYTLLPFDDTQYPNAPLGYEYMQRDSLLIWRKQRSLVTENPVMRLTVGKDAILTGMIQYRPLYTDALIGTQDPNVSVAYSDIDSARRWGGRRFWLNDTSTSSFMDSAYDLAVRGVELYKSERRTFSLTVSRDAFLLYPGDVIALDNAPANGLPDGKFRVSEVVIELSPTLKTTVTVGDSAKLLTDYL